jgi:hypothetical protein
VYTWITGVAIVVAAATLEQITAQTTEQRANPADPHPPAEIHDAVAFARQRLGFHPDALQESVLASTAARGILNCTRQWGKSTVAAIKAVHRAFTHPGSLVVVASPSERQSGEFVRKAAEMLAKLGIRPRGDGHNSISLLLPNKSRIVGLPGVDGAVRGFSAVSLMLIDEASRMRDGMYKALRPMLAVGGGDLWLLSTPAGKQGFFYHAWEHEGDRWFRVKAPVTECPRIEAEFVEEERSSLGAAWFRQEYLCEFIDGGAGLIDRDVVERALTDEVGPLKISAQPWTWN